MTAHLKIDKATFLTILTDWNLIAAYVAAQPTIIGKIGAAGIALTLGIGNSIIVLVGVETGNEPEPTVTSTPASSPAPVS